MMIAAEPTTVDSRRGCRTSSGILLFCN